ncbi:MAG: UDP-glucose/GDP-mannose dehydrogenase family protein [Chloroflexota bacterium]
MTSRPSITAQSPTAWGRRIARRVRPRPALVHGAPWSREVRGGPGRVRYASPMQVSVIGAGYVGLVTAACLARLGNDVRCIDIDAARVERLRRGELPIREPGLDELVSETTAAGRLSFHAETSASHGSRLVIIAVGTLDADGEWFGGLVTRAVEGLARDPDVPRAIVVRSTLLPGTAVAIRELARGIDARIELAFNPEFTREATAVRDFLEPDRVVFGVADPADGGTLLADLRTLYAPLEAPMVVTDLTSAETIKIASNVFLSAKITFANELARLCAATGADVSSVVDGMGLDKRIGRAFLSPGPGFGGSCFPSQARALPELAARFGVDAPLMRAITPSNEGQADWLIDRLEETAGRTVAGWRVAVLGLTFKAGTDDLRESPAMRLATRLVARGATVQAHDPIATEAGVAQLSAAGVVVTAAPSPEAACAGTDAVVAATEWPAFRQLDWAAIAPTMPGRLIADGRHVIDVAAAGAAGYQVVVMGVPARVAERSGAEVA